jgi:hypothetical protein
MKVYNSGIHESRLKSASVSDKTYLAHICVGNSGVGDTISIKCIKAIGSGPSTIEEYSKDIEAQRCDWIISTDYKNKSGFCAAFRNVGGSVITGKDSCILIHDEKESNTYIFEYNKNTLLSPCRNYILTETEEKVNSKGTFDILSTVNKNKDRYLKGIDGIGRIKNFDVNERGDIIAGANFAEDGMRSIIKSKRSEGNVVYHTFQTNDIEKGSEYKYFFHNDNIYAVTSSGGVESRIYSIDFRSDGAEINMTRVFDVEMKNINILKGSNSVYFIGVNKISVWHKETMLTYSREFTSNLLGVYEFAGKINCWVRKAGSNYVQQLDRTDLGEFLTYEGMKMFGASKDVAVISDDRRISLAVNF